MNDKKVADMFDGLISRTPIYTRSLDVFGYELRFLSGEELHGKVSGDGSRLGEYLPRASREFRLEDIVGNFHALIRLPAHCLPVCEEIAWPRQKIVLALSEPSIVDQDACKMIGSLAGQGFTIALHNPSADFSALQREAGFVSICALDASAQAGFKPSSTSPVLSGRPHMLVRELESVEQYDFFIEHGFDYYEGAFFERPRLLPGCEIAGNRLNVLHLIARLQDSKVQIEEVEELIARDVTLSYKLLRLMNSAFFGMPKKVESIRRAVLFFGLQRIKNWATVLLVNSMEFKPRELMATAMVRAKLCELLAADLRHESLEQFYIAGLFSLLDAIMDAPMANILECLNLTPELDRALLEGEGPIGDVLRTVLLHQQGQAHLAPCRQFSAPDVPMRASLEAIRWASEANAQLAEA